MTSLTFDDHCREIVSQTDLLRTQVGGADPTTPVPTCPGWDLGRLLRHVGGDHRWAGEIVRTRAAGPLPDAGVNDPAAYAHLDGDALGAWLGEGAAELGAALRGAGPGVPVWTPADEQLVEQSTSFWARRMTHETVVHRADAVLATGGEFTLGEGLAVDGVEEWLAFSTVPEAYEPGPDAPGLLGPGRTLRFEATGAGEWLVDLTGERPVWRSGGEAAAVSVRGSATELLLFLYRRPVPAVETRGDTALLDLWLTRTGFWLEV
ncbi:maleylpyruvate isomerase family mycothiol-dependent enzyme [Streptomyces sp. CA-249302]|uniref:maleylpyruvate isomerase family mycothiol-dependent enzyme n=1 Tax=Streptomyces sp. CA-249302 TaxID=3240058 RepID=UPI003D921F1C